MRRQGERFLAKLRRFLPLDPERGGVAIADDRIVTAGNLDDARLAESILRHLDVVSLFVVPLRLPFADFLVSHAGESPAIIPRDIETRTFLHDIPVVSHRHASGDCCGAIAHSLRHRKGVVVEGMGIVAAGPLSVEQGYIYVSSLFHSLFVRYVESLMEPFSPLAGEEEIIRSLISAYGGDISADGLSFHPAPLTGQDLIMHEMVQVGRYTVELGLVDSFFGNISCRGGETVFISQTAASLDELTGCIDPVPLDGSSTAGITASSELAAHRRIYESTPFTTILHGHPRWSVVVSMICDRRDRCSIADCGRDCPEVRSIDGIPIVAGEIGAGGLAQTVPPVIGRFGVALVHGHGIFAAGRGEFGEPFRRMVEIENRCRNYCIQRIERNLTAG